METNTLQIGQMISGYRIDEFIGAGAFGKVYKISKENESGKHIAALKHISLPNEEQYQSVLRSMNNDHEQAANYFATILKDINIEINTIKRLSQKSNMHIITYLDNDIVTTKEPLRYDVFIRMEYVQPFLKQPGKTRFTVNDVITVGLHILEALKICHDNQVIHRDIKDDNLFISDNGHYKIGDFGVSKVLERSERAKTIKGTKAFLAPEVLSNNTYDETVDLYSLGIVLYKLVNTDRFPFMPPAPQPYFIDDMEQAIERRLNNETIPMPRLAPKALGEVLLKATASREARFNSADEFKQALVAVQQTLSASELEAVVLELSTNEEKLEDPTHLLETISAERINVESLHTQEILGAVNLFQTYGETQSTSQVNQTIKPDTNASKPMHSTSTQTIGGIAQEIPNPVQHQSEKKSSYFSTEGANNYTVPATEREPEPYVQHQPTAAPEQPTPAYQAAPTVEVKQATDVKKLIIMAAPIVILAVIAMMYANLLQFLPITPLISSIIGNVIIHGLLYVALAISLFFAGRELQKNKVNDDPRLRFKGQDAQYALVDIQGQLKQLLVQQHNDDINAAYNDIKRMAELLKFDQEFGYEKGLVAEKEIEIADQIEKLKSLVNSINLRNFGQADDLAMHIQIINELLRQRKEFLRRVGR